MNAPLSQSSLSQLFTDARTHHQWTDEPVTEAQLRELYDLLKWGPTALNANPARFVFITTPEAKQKLIPALSPSNVPQVEAAPVALVIAHDERFHTRLGDLFPAYDAAPMFEENDALRQSTAFRNSSMQGAYAILAARALGLDTCPMSGFDQSKVDDAFFAGTSLKSNFLLMLGHGKPEGLFPRGPRLAFEDACQIL